MASDRQQDGQRRSLSGAGMQMAAALDPHRRGALTRAIDSVFAEGRFGDQGPRVVLLGWQAATALELVVERARAVTVVEPDEELAGSIEAGVQAGGFGGKVSLLREDPRRVKLEEPADLVVYMPSSVWLIDGEDHEILDHARNALLAADGVLVPRRLVHLFELAWLPHEAGRMPLRLARLSRPGEPVAVLSESKHFLTTDLSTPGPLPQQIDDALFVHPLLGGTINGLRLRTLVELARGVVDVTSFGGVQSVLVPLRDDLEVEERQPISLLFRFELGAGLGKASVSARPVHDREGVGRLDWALSDHEVTAKFRETVGQMIDTLDASGRGPDLDKVVSYTIEPQGDVSRLTALQWTVDEEFQGPLRKLIANLRAEAAAHGEPPDDETVYELMLGVYRQRRGQEE